MNGQPGTGIAGYRNIDLDAMPEAEKAAFARTLYAIHEQIFAGVSWEEFDSHVIHAPAISNRVRLFLDREGRTIGYCAVHVFERKVDGAPALVVRAEAGLQPAFRGRGATYTFGMTESLRAKIRHPGRPVYYLATLVHPSSYHLLFKYFPKLYPSPRTEADLTARRTALQLVESFPDPAVAPDRPGVRDVGWVTIETEAERRLRKSEPPDDVRYFLQMNPGYRQGHGLVVMIPLTVPVLLSALARRLAERAAHALGLSFPRL